MILENTVPNPKSVAPKLQKLQSRKVSINVGRHRQQRRRHQSGKNYSLAKMNFVETKMYDRQNDGMTDGMTP